MSWLVALLICLAMGKAAGFIQGKVSAKFRIPPFIVTPGGLTVWRGATLLIGGGSPVSGFDAGYTWWGNGSFLGVPVPVLVFLVVSVVSYMHCATLHMGGTCTRQAAIPRRRGSPGCGWT